MAMRKVAPRGKAGAELDDEIKREGVTRALVLHPDVTTREAGDTPGREASERLEEALGLARAIELEIEHAEVVRVNKPRPATLFGMGVVERFEHFIKAMEIEVAIIDRPLSPIQQRNLERAWHCKVIDRTALILEIFGARARTHEGRLQVELAAQTFQRSRLVRSGPIWSDNVAAPAFSAARVKARSNSTVGKSTSGSSN